MCGNPSVLHGLGAARNLKADPPDPANPPDPAEMVHPRFSAPEARMTVVKLTPSNYPLSSVLARNFTCGDMGPMVPQTKLT